MKDVPLEIRSTNLEDEQDILLVSYSYAIALNSLTNTGVTFPTRESTFTELLILDIIGAIAFAAVFAILIWRRVTNLPSQSDLSQSDATLIAQRKVASAKLRDHCQYRCSGLCPCGLKLVLPLRQLEI